MQTISALWPLLFVILGSGAAGAYVYDKSTSKSTDDKSLFTFWDGVKVLTVASSIWIAVKAYRMARGK